MNPKIVALAPTQQIDAVGLGRIVLGFTVSQWIRFGGAVAIGAGATTAAVWKLSGQYSAIESKLDDHGRRLGEIETCLDRIAPRTVAKVRP